MDVTEFVSAAEAFSSAIYPRRLSKKKGKSKDTRYEHSFRTSGSLLSTLRG